MEIVQVKIYARVLREDMEAVVIQVSFLLFCLIFGAGSYRFYLCFNTLRYSNSCITILVSGIYLSDETWHNFKF